MTRGALWKQRHGKHRLVDNLSFSIADPAGGGAEFAEALASHVLEND